jgi:hypothetical protein
VIEDDLPRERKTETETVPFARRDERLEQLISNRARYSGSVVLYLDQHEIARVHRLDSDCAPTRHRLKRVRNHIEKDTFHPGTYHWHFDFDGYSDRNLNIPVFHGQQRGICSRVNDVTDLAALSHGFLAASRTGEVRQRVPHLGGGAVDIRRKPHYLSRRLFGAHQHLGGRAHCCKWVPQIMKDRS